MQSCSLCDKRPTRSFTSRTANVSHNALSCEEHANETAKLLHAISNVTPVCVRFIDRQPPLREAG